MIFYSYYVLCTWEGGVRPDVLSGHADRSQTRRNMKRHAIKRKIFIFLLFGEMKESSFSFFVCSFFFAFFVCSLFFCFFCQRKNLGLCICSDASGTPQLKVTPPRSISSDTNGFVETWLRRCRPMNNLPLQNNL